MEVVVDEELEFPGMDERLDELERSARKKSDENFRKAVELCGPAPKAWPWHHLYFWQGAMFAAAVCETLIAGLKTLPWVEAWEMPPTEVWVLVAITFGMWAAWLALLYATRKR